MNNPKSDVKAKQAFKAHLEARGEFSDVRIVGSPTDIVAKKGEEEFYFEIKSTSKTRKYFGAATLTEWEAALNSPERFKFVVAQPIGEDWKFTEYTPEEFLEFSDIPPFKIFFKVQLGEVQPKRQSKRKRGKAVKLTLENLRKMIEFRAELKSLQDGEA
jgi:Holliday junction resolvase